MHSSLERQLWISLHQADSTSASVLWAVAWAWALQHLSIALTWPTLGHRPQRSTRQMLPRKRAGHLQRFVDVRRGHMQGKAQALQDPAAEGLEHRGGEGKGAAVVLVQVREQQAAVAWRHEGCVREHSGIWQVPGPLKQVLPCNHS